MAALDAAWLAVELEKALGWDSMIVQGVTDAIIKSTNKADVTDIVEVRIALYCLQARRSGACAPLGLALCPMQSPGAGCRGQACPSDCATPPRCDRPLLPPIQNFMNNDPKAGERWPLEAAAALAYALLACASSTPSPIFLGGRPLQDWCPHQILNAHSSLQHTPSLRRRPLPAHISPAVKIINEYMAAQKRPQQQRQASPFTPGVSPAPPPRPSAERKGEQSPGQARGSKGSAGKPAAGDAGAASPEPEVCACDCARGWLARRLAGWLAGWMSS